MRRGIIFLFVSLFTAGIVALSREKDDQSSREADELRGAGERNYE